MPILDHRGNPVDTSRLMQELAAPNVSGIRQVLHESLSSGLTPESLGNIMRQAREGDAYDYLTLAEDMEERDLHYSSQLRTRKLAVSSMSVAIDAASDDAKDVEIADAVRAFTKRGAFRQLLADQLDAIGKGYSVSEIFWDKSGKYWRPKKYVHRDPRHFQFDRETAQELRLRDEKDLVNGIALEPYKFIVHMPQLKTGLPIRGGLAMLVATSFMCKSYGLKDWMVFAEVFGMPLRVGKYGASATAEQKAALLRALTNIGTDAAAMIPDSMIIEFIASTSATGGDKLFQGLADYLDSQVSKAVLGQTMTADNGSSLSQASVHNEVRGDIRDDDALKLAATIERDLIRPFVDLNWGQRDDDGYPVLRLFREKQEDLKALAEALTPFIDRGLKVSASVIRDKFNLEAPAEDEETLAPQGGASPFGGFGGFDGPPVPDDDSPDVASMRRKTTIALMNRMLAGETLTADQRRFVELAARGDADEIDKLADEVLDDANEVMAGVTEPILQLARNVKSFDELKNELASLDLDSSKFVESLAAMTMKARGRGDATDKP